MYLWKQSLHVRIVRECLILKQGYVLWYHTECKYESVRKAGNQCDKQITHQGHVVTHTYDLYIHKCVKYACNQCYKQYPQERHLTRYVQSVNE